MLSGPADYDVAACCQRGHIGWHQREPNGPYSVCRSDSRARPTVVDDARARLVGAGLSVEADVLEGRPATAIVDAARTWGADLTVLGSRGHVTIESMVLGSVSAEVVDHAPTPVLVASGGRVGRVVLAWDGSSCASQAADLLLTWSIFAETAVRVVSVAPTPIPLWAGLVEPAAFQVMPSYLEAADLSRQEHDRLAREMTERLRAAGLTAEPDRRDGDAAAEILAAAKESSADLVVLGTHGRTGISRLLLGSVARNVLQHASCSVLVVREAFPAVGS